jgi:CheY-like chemotaxis protein
MEYYHQAPSDTVLTVLVVDDNPDLLASVSFALQTIGNFRVITASDGIGGLKTALEVMPDCMVIDIKMPGIDGYQLVRALRGDPATSDIPLVILSALAQPDDIFMGLAYGTDRYLTKPLDVIHLIDTIREVITLSDEDRYQQLKRMVEDD